MRVGLLLVAEALHELLNRLRLLVVVPIPLRVQTHLIDQNVGVGRDAGDRACHVLVYHVHFLGRLGRLEQLRVCGGGGGANGWVNRRVNARVNGGG